MLCILVSIGLLNGAEGAAQTPASAKEQAELERLVLTEWMQHTVRDPTKRASFFADWAVEHQLQATRHSGPWRPSTLVVRSIQESQRLASMLGSGAVLVEGDSCADVACRLGTFRGMIAFTPAVIRGDTAEIDIHSHYWPSIAPKRPKRLWSEIETWTFCRTATGWRRVAYRSVWIT